MRIENMIIDNGDIIMDDSKKSGVFNTYKPYLSYVLTYFSTRYAAIISLFFIIFQKVSQTISFIITDNQSDFFLLLVFRWAFKNNQTQCAVLWFEFLCTRNTINERLILGGLINSNMLDRKHCWCYYWLDTFRELIFAGIKFCEFRELWSLSRKLFPAKII